MFKFFPNVLTLLNLIFGSLAIFYITTQFDFMLAWYFLLIASFFDFFDGLVARWLMAESSLGKELDALSDMVTFGVFPAIFFLMFFKLIPLIGFVYAFVYVPGLVYIICVALRLAKFNVDSTSGDHFKGLPSPAAALLLVSSLLFLSDYFKMGTFLFFEVIVSLLMIVPVPLESFKMKTTSSKILVVTLGVISIVSIFTLKWKGVPLIVGAYYLMGLLFYQLRKKAIF